MRNNNRHVRENLTEEELTDFDILSRLGPDLSPAERNEIKKVAQVLLERLKTVLTLDWRKRVDATENAARIRLILQPNFGIWVQRFISSNTAYWYFPP